MSGHVVIDSQRQQLRCVIQKRTVSDFAGGRSFFLWVWKNPQESDIMGAGR